MSFHRGPEYIAPNDIRCQATVKGHPSWHWEWARHDHQCPRKANQMRGQYQVCWQHAQQSTFTAWECTETQNG